MSYVNQGEAAARRLVGSLIAIGAAIMVAGCGGAGSVAAPAATSSVVPRPNPLQAAPPIPAVKNPRDVAAVSSRPCDLLTAQQAGGFRLDMPPAQLTGLRGTQRCMWTKTTIPDRMIIRMVNVSMSTSGPTFEAVYERDRGLPTFELTDIAGYPAIVTRTNAKSPTCAVKIKTAEGQSLVVDYEDKDLAKDPQQSCVVGKQVASAVLMNVPTKS
ncbi:MAG TPA: DUF3558 domain-containing protein [Pseudonocardiaceae bacterium]|nr:DUF3558 domain-containing protein [Pseudonocardiaceae bacterium]